MAWDAQGKWIPDQNTPTEAAPVQAQAQQVTDSVTPPNVQTLGAPAATSNPAPAGTVNTTATPAPTPGDASVESRLTGLLSSDSPYMKLARAGGQRQAARRGLLNSSIAAGASEAAAIAAAAPIASQDAAQQHQINQTNLEGDIQLRNAQQLQTQQDASAKERLNLELTNRIDLQTLGDSAAMERLLKQGDLEKVLQEMRNDNALTQTQINANVSLLGNYMQAFATLSQNPELPASARDAYMREFLRVTQSGQALVNALSGVEVTWGGSGTTQQPAPVVNTSGGGGALAAGSDGGGGLGGRILSQLGVSRA